MTLIQSDISKPVGKAPGLQEQRTSQDQGEARKAKSTRGSRRKSIANYHVEEIVVTVHMFYKIVNLP